MPLLARSAAPRRGDPMDLAVAQRHADRMRNLAILLGLALLALPWEPVPLASPLAAVFGTALLVRAATVPELYRDLVGRRWLASAWVFGLAGLVAGSVRLLMGLMDGGLWR